MVIVILLVLGLCLGSFINAFVWRHYQQAMLREEAETGKRKKPKKDQLTAEQLSISKGRSMCTHCHHVLAPMDLIPVVSFIILRGKCRYCGKRIEDTPLAELLTPLLFIVSYLFWPTAMTGQGLFMFVSWLVFVCGFVALILYDLRWFLLPHNIVLPLIGLALVRLLVASFVYDGGVRMVLDALLGAVIIGGLFYILFKVSKEQWIGGGDIMLGVLLGLLAGSASASFLLIFLSSFFGTLVAIPLLLVHKAKRTTHLPFGPFLIIAAVVVVLFGSHILSWYAGAFTDWMNHLFTP